MGRIDELIREYCPNGVEYLAIKQTSNNIFSGGTPSTSRSDYYDGNIPWLRSGEIDFNTIDSTERMISEEGYNNSSAKWIKEHCVLLAMTGATVGRSAVNNIKLTANQSVCAIEPNNRMNYKFLYYCLANKYNEIRSMGQGALTSLNKALIESIVVPVPPLEVQQEIVRMLNSYTELEAELEAELTKRKQQFTFFRDLLFSIENLEKEGGKIRRCTLGEIAEFERGGSFQKKDFIEEGEVPCIHYGQIYTRFNNTSVQEPLTYISTEVAKKQKFAHTNDLVMAITSENMEDVCKTIVWNGEQDIAVSGHTTIIRHNENPKFLAYFFQTADFFSQKRRVARGTKVIEISPESLKKIVINLPERKVQDKIAETIESFELLMTDMSSGLPAEIKARHKQYEYYRDKLLTFEERVAK